MALNGLEIRIVDLPGDGLATAFGRMLSLDVGAVGVGFPVQTLFDHLARRSNGEPPPGPEAGSPSSLIAHRRRLPDGTS